MPGAGAHGDSDLGPLVERQATLLMGHLCEEGEQEVCLLLKSEANREKAGVPEW